MKIKVNTKWYTQGLRELKEGKQDEKRILVQQLNRYKDAINGEKQAFDVKQNISTNKLFEYLQEAVESVGKSEPKIKTFINTYEPCNKMEVDWVGVEKAVKEFCETNSGLLCRDDNEYLHFISDLFCTTVFAIPESEENNDRVFEMVDKYFVSCFDEEN
jgi:hypothetical protein